MPVNSFLFQGSRNSDSKLTALKTWGYTSEGIGVSPNICFTTKWTEMYWHGSGGSTWGTSFSSTTELS